MFQLATVALYKRVIYDTTGWSTHFAVVWAIHGGIGRT